MKHYFYQALEENPIIAAIKNMDDLELCCSLEEIRVVFVLFGDICTIRTIVKRLKDAGKIAIVHVDLIVGLSSKEIVVDFIKMSTEADGIMPQVISKMCKVSKAPIIAGGLISEKESVMSAISAGAMAVSSTNHEVWKL